MRKIDQVIPDNNLVYSDQVECVYTLTDVKTRDVYIGSTSNAYGRMQQHARLLLEGSHPNANVQNAFDNGVGFRLELMPVVGGKQERIVLEQAMIQEHFFDGNLLNIALDAEVSARGRPLSPERIEALRAVNKGRVKSDYELQRISETHKGKIVSEETREKLRQSRIGMTLSEEHKANISAGGMGRIVTEETRQKLSDHHYRKTPIRIGEQEYPSLAEAARQMGVTPATVRGRIVSENPEYAGYRYANAKLK